MLCQACSQGLCADNLVNSIHVRPCRKSTTEHVAHFGSRPGGGAIFATHHLPMEGPPVSTFTAALPPNVPDAILKWTTDNKVTAARQLAYLFDDSEAFAAAVGLQASDTANLWPAFEGHAQAWATFRLHESLNSRVSWPVYVPLPRKPTQAFQPASAATVKPVKQPNAASVAKAACASGQPVPSPKQWTADSTVINHLWELMIRLGPLGAFHADLEAHSTCMASYRDLWCKRFGDMDAKGMRQRWGHWKAWNRWCRAPKPPQQPVPVLAGLFGSWLRDKAKGGPTAAPSALLGVCWVAKHSGLPMPEAGLLQPWRKAPLSHTPAQAVAYPIRVNAHFDQLSRSANVYIAHACSLSVPATMLKPLVRELLRRGCDLAGGGGKGEGGGGQAFSLLPSLLPVDAGNEELRSLWALEPGCLEDSAVADPEVPRSRL